MSVATITIKNPQKVIKLIVGVAMFRPARTISCLPEQNGIICNESKHCIGNIVKLFFIVNNYFGSFCLLMISVFLSEPKLDPKK